MSFIRHAFQTMHPAAQIVLLACIVLAFMALAAGVGLLWASNGDMEALKDLIVASQMGTLSREAMLAMNNANQLLAFFGASWAFAALVGRTYLGRFFIGSPRGLMWILAVVLAIGMSPLLDFAYRFNQWALVPGSDIHSWAGGLEAQAMAITKSILQFSTKADVLPVLISVAVLPALCEEWLFRGTLQPLLIKASGNVHVGIWVSAAIFSAIHLQFFGFLPRMFLGAAFGYLVAYSRSLWPAILGHFVNNASVVVVAWWMGSSWLDEGLEPQSLSSWGAMDWGMAALGLAGLSWAITTLIRQGNSQDYEASLLKSATTTEQTPLQL